MSSNPKSSHPLRGLFAAQFGGAFNDAAFKLIVIGLALRSVTATLDDAGREASEQLLTGRAFLVFNVPLIVFSLPAGVWADRISKRTQILLVKALEVALMTAGVVMLVRSPADPLPLEFVLAALGLHSAFFAPAKYGILPEIVPHERLSKANGLLETVTVIALISGSVAGPFLLAKSGASTWMAVAGLALLSLAGLAFAFTIPRVPAARASSSVLATVRAGWSALHASRVLRLSVLGSAFLWFFATAIGAIAFAHARHGLGLREELAGLPLGVLGAGFALGALAAGRLSQNRVELGLVPLGSIGLALSDRKSVV